MDSRSSPKAKLDHAQPAPVVVTADEELLDQILAVLAAAGSEPLVVADPGSLRPVWNSAPMVLVGVDQAEVVAGLVLPRRAEVYVVGEETAQASVCQWSVPLGAAVALLPTGAGWLTSAVADLAGLRTGTGRVIAVVGGCGGVGASTLAAGLGFVAAQRGAKTLLVDADPLGGGIDLLVGAERTQGWRWPRLATARGHLGDLAGHLPRLEGLDVLAVARGEAAVGYGLTVESMKSVLLSATRSHQSVVIDVARDLPPAGREALRHADITVLLTAGDLRGVAAAQQVLQQLSEVSRDLRLAVRTFRSGALDAMVVADGLALPLVASWGEDASLRLAAHQGDPPGRSRRSALTRGCRDILDALTEIRSDAA